MSLGTIAKVNIGWAVCIAAGLFGFVLSKRSVDAKRYENMKIRERMRENIYNLPSQEKPIN